VLLLKFPFPAGGQALALLEDRKIQALAQIEHFTKNFDMVRSRKSRPLSQEGFESRRQMQINKALMKERKSPRRMSPKLAIPYHILCAEGFSSVVLNCLSSIVRGP